MGKIKVAVIGAGVIGLTSAYSIKLFDENIDVTVFAEKFSPNTTSDGAAGVFLIFEARMRDAPTYLLRRWGATSYNWLKENYKKERAVDMGISLSSGYVLSTEESITVDAWSSIVDHYWLTPKQLEEFGSEIRSGIFATTFMCECRKYLPWLLERHEFKEKKGKVIKKKINSFDELASYDVIVNCSGIGAVELCNDKELQPIRGQVARVKAPWIRHWYHVVRKDLQPARIFYVFPNNKDVVLGGTSDMSWDLAPSTKTHQQIFEGTQKLIPSLKHAEFLTDWVGLRPSRSSVRLEKEDVLLKAGPHDAPRSVKIVHNYGQGASGVSLSWGCAQHAVELVAKCIEEITAKKVVSKL